MAEEQGTLVSLYPPTNEGETAGAGLIVTEGGGAYAFVTPSMNDSEELTVGESINFKTNECDKITSVSQ